MERVTFAEFCKLLGAADAATAGSSIAAAGDRPIFQLVAQILPSEAVAMLTELIHASADVTNCNYHHYASTTRRRFKRREADAAMRVFKALTGVYPRESELAKILY